MSFVADTTAAAARRLWDVAELRAAYKEAMAAIGASTRRLDRMSTEDAMVETFAVGGSILRRIVLDPLLPDPIVPTAERKAMVAAMIEYDKLGRSCWAAFMREHGVRTSATPSDRRMFEGATAARARSA